MKKTIIIAGGSGLFGTYLSRYFKDKYTVKVLTRGAAASPIPGVEYVQWDGRNTGEWVKELEGAEALINLAGKSINCRFTEENKKKLLSSRLASTRVLAEAIASLEKPPKVWLNASAGAMYVPGEKPNTENDSSLNSGFLSEMAVAWEEAFFEKPLPNTRRVAMRISLLLGNEGGVFPVWKKLTKLFLGGKAGSGEQIVSWMHLHDATSSVEFLLENNLEGPVNFSTNHPLPNAELMRTLRDEIGVPFGLPAPTFGIKMAAPIVGAEPSLLLDSVNFVPEKLSEAGFSFEYGKFEDACKALLNE